MVHLKTGRKLNVLVEKLHKWTVENYVIAWKETGAVILIHIIKPDE